MCSSGLGVVTDFSASGFDVGQGQIDGQTAGRSLAMGGISGFTVGLFCGRAVRLQRALNALRRDKGIVLP
jgi:hypothetical protein